MDSDNTDNSCMDSDNTDKRASVMSAIWRRTVRQNYKNVPNEDIASIFRVEG
jgi:hypothetical protein